MCTDFSSVAARELVTMRTRTPEVYLALANIYAEDIRRIEEAVRLKKQEAAQSASPRVTENAKVEPASNWSSYMRGSARNIDYEVMSEAENRPRVAHVVVPYYPPELLAQKIGGEVVLDVQVTEPGKVGGIWLISSTPEIFGNLATALLRQFA